jgi:hypothetical protein
MKRPRYIRTTSPGGAPMDFVADKPVRVVFSPAEDRAAVEQLADVLARLLALPLEEEVG